MTYTYGIISETFSFDGHARTAYGIALYAHVEETGTGSIVATVCDLSADKESVLKLVNACNEENLLPIHLCDVVEDFLAQ